VTYPGRARRRNLEGKVVMSATVSRAGELLSVETAEASKYGALNRASEKAIKKASPFPAAPDTLSGESFVLTVPVVFKVPER
jgi:TonB family protein